MCTAGKYYRHASATVQLIGQLGKKGRQYSLANGYPLHNLYLVSDSQDLAG